MINQLSETASTSELFVVAAWGAFPCFLSGQDAATHIVEVKWTPACKATLHANFTSAFGDELAKASRHSDVEPQSTLANAFTFRSDATPALTHVKIRGIDWSRLTPNSLGEANHIDLGNIDAAHQENQRIELRNQK